MSVMKISAEKAKALKVKLPEGQYLFCTCGHPYEDHVDAHGKPRACGRRKCGCGEFRAMEPQPWA